MNIAIEELSACRRRLTIEVPPDQVEKECADILKDFQKHASIKGFRPGKAPVGMVEKKYRSQIDEEAKRALIPKAYREAVKEKQLNVVSQPAVEDLKFERGLSMSFSIVVDLAPEFTLPTYKGIKVNKAETEATDEDVQKVLDHLLDQQANYINLEGRAPTNDDFAVLDFTGTVDGKPIKELADNAEALSEQKHFWLKLEENAFLPGFTPQLMDLKPGESKDITVTIPDDFPQEPLKGKEAVFQVTLIHWKEKVLPEFDDEMAQEMAQVNAAELKERIKENIQREKEQKAREEQVQQIITHLKDKVNCELPESAVESETRSVLQNIVRENQQRGVPDEVIQENQSTILENAQGSARDRVKVDFILSKIAEAEKIDIESSELAQEIQLMAVQYQTTPEKIYRTLEENGGILQLQEDIRKRKTIEFLLKNAEMT